MNNSTIAIVLCFYNNMDTLQKTLDSLVSQTYENFVCFMIDDGSFDSSVEIAEKVALSDVRFKYFKLAHSGLGMCRNFALEKIYSDGYRYLAFIDSDDFYATNKLEIQYKELHIDESLVLVASGSNNVILEQYMKLDFNSVQGYRKEKFNDSFFELMQTNFRFAPASALIDLSRVSVRPFNSSDVSGQDFKFFLDLFFDNPNKLIVYGDLYTCSVRVNSVQRRKGAKLSSAIARYSATQTYSNTFKDLDDIKKTTHSIDRYLSWISYETQQYYGYFEGVKTSIQQYDLYHNKILFLKSLIRRALNFKMLLKHDRMQKNN